MSELRVALSELVSVKEAARSLPRVLDRLARNEADHLVITRRSRPQAVLVPVERYEALLRAAAAAGPTAP